MPINNHSVLTRTLLIYLLFFWGAITMAQEPVDNARPQNIISYLQKLENNYNIKFSFIDSDIYDISIEVNPNQTVLSHILDDIHAQTQLVFQRLNDRYYTITLPDTITICATVLDNFEQNTITAGTIEVINTGKYTTTNNTGHFSLDSVPNTAMVRIKHIGFKPLYLTAKEIAKEPCKTLVLKVDYQQLDEVVVHQILTTGITQKQDSRIKIDTYKFGLLPGLVGPDVLQTIQALPGIKSIDETVSDINIRGGTNDQNLILWDGIKMYQSGHFFGLISAFNPYLIKDVSIIKNGTSATYGNGISGIIDMQTANTLPKKLTAGAGVNLISGDLYVNTPLTKKTALQISGRRSFTDAYNGGTYVQYRQRVFQDSEVIESDENFYFYDISAKFLYDISNNQKLKISLINTANTLDYTKNSVVNNGTTNSKLDQTNLSFGGYLNSNWTSKLSSELSFYQTNYELESKNTDLTNNEQQLLQENMITENSVKLSTFFTFNPLWKLTSGAQISSANIVNKTFVNLPSYAINDVDHLNTNSFFSEVQVTPDTKDLYLRIGARITNYKATKNLIDNSFFEPRFNFSYNLNKYYKVSVLGEFKTQAIHQVTDLEQNFLGVEKRRWVLANGNNLPITTSKHGSVGVNYDRNQTYIGLSYFYKNVDGISTKTQGFENENQFTGELGNYTIQGLEFLINQKTTHFSSWLSYAYNLNNFSFYGIIPPTFPNNLDIRHNLNIASTYNIHNFKFSLGVHYRSGKPFTAPQKQNPLNLNVLPNTINYEEPNSSRLPEYVRADASAAYNFNLNDVTKATIGASVINIADRNNILNSYYRVNDGTLETVKNVSLGFTPNINFRVNF